MTRWVGFCAPGRKPFAWLYLYANPSVDVSEVTEIYEEPNLAGKTDIVLVDLDALPSGVRSFAESALEAQRPATWPDGGKITWSW